MLGVNRAKQDRGAVHRARRQHEETALNLRAVGQFGRDDAPAARVRAQADDLRFRPQLHVLVPQHRVDEPGLGIALGAEPAREAVAGIAAHAGAALVVLHRRRHRERAQALGAQAFGERGDHRVVAERRVRVGARARRLRRVGARLAMHAEEALGAGVIGLQRVVVDGPGRRQPASVLHGREIFPPEAEHGGAEHLGVAADMVELPRPEGAAAAVDPALVGPVGGIGVDRFGVPVAIFARQARAALENHDAGAGGRQDVRDTAAAHAGPDDDDIETAGHRLRDAARSRDRRAPPWTCRP